LSQGEIDGKPDRFVDATFALSLAAVARFQPDAF
jgi:hypothetical protein